MGSWMKRIQLLLLLFPPRASSRLFLPPSSNLLPGIEPLNDPFVDVFEFGGVDQDNVDQDHVDQDHVDEDHVDQDHVDQGLLGDEQSITSPTMTLDGYRCLPDQFCFTLFNKTRSVMGIINSSPNLSLLSRALALTAITTNLNEVGILPLGVELLVLLQCLIPPLPG